jgi:hypothetical protein
MCSRKTGNPMMETLQIDLQEGFGGDTVVIQVDGRQVFRQDSVTTRLLLGYAQIVQVQMPRGQVQVEITIPNRALSKTESVSIPGEQYLAVSIRPDGIEMLRSDTPFPYL